MGYQITESFLNKEEIEITKKWLSKYDFLWKDFSTDKETKRKAFTGTFTKDNLPIQFKNFKTNKHNLYHIVAISTLKSGSIEPHIDSDFRDRLISEIPGSMVSFPETVIYYFEIDENMKGGSLVINNVSIKPVKNSAITIEPKTSHSVTSITETGKPRIALVCERYFIRGNILKNIKTPDYREG